MTDTEVVAKYVKAFASLRLDENIAREEGERKARALARELLELGDDAVLVEVLGRFTSVDGGLYSFLAGEIERYMENQTVSMPGCESQAGVLVALPVLCYCSPGAMIPAQVSTDLLPRLPSGSRVPRLSGVLLRWDELYSHPSRVRELHTLLANSAVDAPHQVLDQQVMSWQTAPAAEDVFSNFANERGRTVSLRFLVAYKQSGEPEWFADERQMQAWSDAAFHRSRALGSDEWMPWVCAPQRLIAALYFAHHQYVSYKHRQFEAQLVELGYRRSDVELLIEPFGAQASSVALTLRCSAFSKQDRRPLCWVAYSLSMVTMRGDWLDRCERRRGTLIESGFDSVNIAPLVQPLEMLPNAIPGQRLHIIFGPTRAFVEAPTEGLPLDSANDPTHSAGNWWKFERETGPITLKALVTVLAPAIRVSPEAVNGKHCFVLLLDDRLWYSAFILDFAPALDNADTAATWPPDEATIKGALATISLMTARAWERHEVIAA